MDLSGQRVLITGGTGSLGHALVERLLKGNVERVVVFSRDEMKQWEMRKRFPDARMDWFLGDVRDAERLRRAFHRVDTVIHAAAMKIVPTAEYDPEECVRTNIMGAMNVIDAALDSKVSRVVALSTDKAVAPVNLYGATKLCSDKLFLAANNYNRNGRPVFSVVRYGNVMGSRGSVLPLWVEQARRGVPLTITHRAMTRFMLPIEGAVDLVLSAFGDETGQTHIPRLPAMRMWDAAAAVVDWVSGAPFLVEEIGVRPGEKLHEALAEDYTSDRPDRWFTKKELQAWLQNQFGPSSSDPSRPVMRVSCTNS